MRFTILCEPVAKPRGRQLLVRDRDAKPGVLAWRAFAARARQAALIAGIDPRIALGPLDDGEPDRLMCVGYFALPASWSNQTRANMGGTLHRVKPDGNHWWNAVADALWKRDQRIAIGYFEARWDDGKGPRVEVEVS